MKEKKKIMILYTNYGTGHYKAALAIRDYIQNKYDDKEIILMDPLTYGRPIINRLFAQVGKLMATRLRRFRGKIYDKKMYRDYFKKSWFYDFCINLFFTKRVKKEILRIDPDIIISTQVGPTGLIAKNRKLFKAKLVSVLTDYGIHRMFTVAHEFVDVFCVATEDLKKQMIDLGIDENKIKVTGIPVANNFRLSKKYDKTCKCQDWKIPDDNPIFLFVCGGGNGYDNALKYFKQLVSSSYNFSYVFVAGKNKRLFNKATRIGDDSAKFGVTLKYVDDMEELIGISDLVFGKPGGLITSETLSMDVPFIALDPIPGQENHNGRFILDNDFGLLIENYADFSLFLDNMKNDDEIILKWKKNIKNNFKDFEFIDIDDI